MLYLLRLSNEQQVNALKHVSEVPLPDPEVALRIAKESGVCTLIRGPTASGKRSLVRALAKEMHKVLIEVPYVHICKTVERTGFSSFPLGHLESSPSP